MTSILLVKKFLGLVEMTSGLVNGSFSLPEWQAVKMIFFAPWVWLKIVFLREKKLLAIQICYRHDIEKGEGLTSD